MSNPKGTHAFYLLVPNASQTLPSSLLTVPPFFVSSVTENCSTRQQVTRRDEWGQLLLTTPAVSHSLAQHLGVSGMSPGVPLEEEVRTGLLGKGWKRATRQRPATRHFSQQGPWSSHWEARLLQGSIMAATFDGAQRTRLDPITLAAFKDSGWYQVNHSAAEELLWGQGERQGH